MLQQSWSSDTFMEKVTEFTASLCEIDKATDLKLPAYRNVASRLVLHGITRTKDLVGLTPEEAGQIFTKIDEVALARRIVSALGHEHQLTRRAELQACDDSVSTVLGANDRGKPCKEP